MFRDFIRVADNVRCRRTYKEQVLRFVLSEVTWLLTYQVRMCVSACTYTHPGSFNLFNLKTHRRTLEYCSASYLF